MPRPKKYDIDPQQVEKMASYGMKNTEIADSWKNAQNKKAKDGETAEVINAVEESPEKAFAS